MCFSFGNCSETPVVEKEVVEVDAPKVVDEEESNEVAENGNGEEAAAPAEAAENGSTEETAQNDAEEVTSAEEVDVQNGDSTGKSNKQQISKQTTSIIITMEKQTFCSENQCTARDKLLTLRCKAVSFATFSLHFNFIALCSDWCKSNGSHTRAECVSVRVLYYSKMRYITFIYTSGQCMVEFSR